MLQLPMFGNLSCECMKLKKVAFLNTYQSATYVSSTSLLTESYGMLIIDSGSTDHLSWYQEEFMEFHQVSSKSRWMQVENNVKL